jgi:hypothetical protein
MWWPVSNSGVTGFSVQGLQRPPYTLPRHRLLTCASTYAFTTTESQIAGLLVPLNLDAGVIISIWLTCYGLRFVEQRPGDQSGTYQDLFKR